MLYACYRHLLEKHLGITVNHPTKFDENFHARVGEYSDMQKISQLLQVSIMESNYALGM